MSHQSDDATGAVTAGTDQSMTADRLAPAGDANAAAKTKPKRNWLGWGLAIGILAACFIFLDTDIMLAALSNLSWLEIAIILGLYTLDRILMALKWWLLLRPIGVQLSFWQIIKIYYQGSFSGTFMPSHVGGDLLRGYWVMQRSGISHPVFASLLVERLIGVLSAANWAVLGGMIYFIVVSPGLWLVWLGLGILALVIGNGLAALTLQQRFHQAILRGIGKLTGRKAGSKIGNLMHKFYQGYAGFSAHKGVLVQNMILTIIEHGVQMGTVIFIAYSLEIDALTVVFFAATAVFMFMMRLPIAPDGWGVGELSAIALFVPIGVQAESAFAMTFAGHVLVTLALVPGFFFLIFNRHEPPPPDAVAEMVDANATRLGTETTNAGSQTAPGSDPVLYDAPRGAPANQKLEGK